MNEELLHHIQTSLLLSEQEKKELEVSLSRLGPELQHELNELFKKELDFVLEALERHKNLSDSKDMDAFVDAFAQTLQETEHVSSKEEELEEKPTEAKEAEDLLAQL